MSVRRVCVVAASAVTLLFTSCSIPRWPVEGRLTSAFGVRFTGGLNVHRGVDIFVSEGTPVRAMSGGRVRFAGVMDGYGNVVWIDHSGQVRAVYAHLSEIHVAEADEVEGRQIIGLSGTTGDANGPHLHFEVWRRGKQVDPVQMLGGPPG